MKKIDRGISGCGGEALTQDKDIVPLVSQGFGDLLQPATGHEALQAVILSPRGNNKWVQRAGTSPYIVNVQLAVIKQSRCRNRYTVVIL